MTKTLLDTDILLEIIRKKDRNVLDCAEAYLKQFDRYTVSSLTVMEVVRGLKHSGSTDQIDEVMEDFAETQVIAFGIEEAELSGRILGDLDKAGLPACRSVASTH